MRGACQPGPSFAEALERVRGALSARPARPLAVPGFRRAGVLIPLIARPAGPSVLFTVRADTLPHHRGEISFPGGGCVPGEEPIAAALREAEEEVGLRLEQVDVLGALDDVPSVSRYVVTPFAAAVADPPAAFAPAAGEVVEGFEVPLATLLDPSVRRASLWDPARLPVEVAAALRDVPLAPDEIDPVTGHLRVWSFRPDPSRNVWGLTARILADLLDRAFAGGAP